MTTQNTHARRHGGRVPHAERAHHEEELVDAAQRVFAKFGYPDTSIDMLAREAKASTKTIYSRFGGKAGLFQAVIEKMVRSPLHSWETLDPNADPKQVLVEAADLFLARVLSPSVVAIERTILAEAIRMPELAKMFYAKGPRRGLDSLRKFFAAQHQAGRLRLDDPELGANLFVSMLEGELVRKALFLGELPSLDFRRKWVHRIVEIFLAMHAHE